MLYVSIESFIRMLYKQDLFLDKFCKKIKQEPFSWSNLLTPIRIDLPNNSIIDLHSFKLVD